MIPHLLGFTENSERSRLTKSPLIDSTDETTDQDEPLTSETLASDPMTAAQNVLTAARHKLALPFYTGHRPAYLSRTSPSNVGNTSAARENDITLEDELEFKFDRTFRSLDPRVRHQRVGGVTGQGHHHHHHSGASSRPYFPYSHGGHYSSRY